MWVDPDDDARDRGIPLTDERSVLVDYLRAYRLTLQMKCADLDAAQMAERSVPPSTMSLLGIVRHMAEVERHWFRRVMAGEDVPRRYAGRDADWDGAIADPDVVADAWAAWTAEVEVAKAFVDATDDLGTLAAVQDDQPLQLREVLVHMIEEYARHCGHADLLRERVDGRTGQ
jgi:uncharacterized damage-inducible protein DinB